MSDFQTEAEFAKHVDTNFRIELEESGHMDLKLVSVTPRKVEPHEQPGMERFSAVFSGPLDFFLPQQTYHLSHPEMGEFDVFLVAIGKEADGFRYEAVYNYYRK
jgi:Domain of unknown function (DUF6916)